LSKTIKAPANHTGFDPLANFISKNGGPKPSFSAEIVPKDQLLVESH